MLFSDLLGATLDSARSQLRNSTVAIGGIAWGLAALLLLLAYGNGLAKALLASHESIGKGLILVSEGQTAEQAGGERAGRVVRLTREDVDYLRIQGLPVSGVGGETLGRFLFRNGASGDTERGVGVDAVYGRIRNVRLEEGRFLVPEDVEERRRVVVLGGALKARLFGRSPAVGQGVLVEGHPYQVVGVVARRAQILLYNGRDDGKAYFPWTTFRELLGTRYLSDVVVGADGSLPDREVAAQIRVALARRRGFSPTDERALRIVVFSERMAGLLATIAGLKWLLGLIGVTTLAIGGVGVANTMFIMIRQRTREIGLRMALGARRRVILLQVLAEALLLCVTGGLLGAGLAVLVVWLCPPLPFLSVFTNAVGAAVSDFEPSRDGDIVLALNTATLVVASAVLVGTGLVAGMWPARRASRIDPAICLRYE